ncbi:hypothetical protein JCM3775_006029 [Rhodotorula graminis]
MATFTNTRKPGTTSTATAAKPKLRADAATLKKYGCFLDNGAVLCFCNTEPRIQATRRVTRKESSPNLGREFWSCGSWIEDDNCGFFLWCDQAATLGRGLRTPPPADKPALPPLAKPITPATSPQKRPRARSPPAFRPSTTASTTPAPALAPASTPTKPRRQPAVAESFDDVDFDSLDAGLDDEIEDDDDDNEPLASGSPSKKPRFESFASPSSGASRAGTATPSTSQHWQGAAASSTPGKPRAGGFEAIRADPDSPFHALQKELFGGGGTSGAENGTASSPAPVSPSKAGPAPHEGAPSSFDALSAALASAAEAVELVKKEREKEARLQVAARRKEEVLKKAVERAKEESEAVRRENERLKERIRMLEEENNELRTR